MSILVPASIADLTPADAAASPFHQLTSFATRAAFKEARDVPADQRRLLTEHFGRCFNWQALQPLLPLRLVVPADVPAWSPRLCRSHYQWLPPDDIQSGVDLAGQDDFDLVLRMFDFSPWRPLLAQRFISHIGPPPFDPVSLALAALLGRWRTWSWSTLHTELCHPTRGADYRRRLGFSSHDLPTPSTLRTALNLTEQRIWLQCADSLVRGLMALGLIPTRSTLPGDGADQGVTIALDFGYKAKTFNIVDDRLFTYWALSGPFVPANRNDHLQTIPGFDDLRRRFPNLNIGEVTGDAGEAYDEVLRYIYAELGALRLLPRAATKSMPTPLPVWPGPMTPRARPSVLTAMPSPSTVMTISVRPALGSVANAAATSSSPMCCPMAIPLTPPPVPFVPPTSPGLYSAHRLRAARWQPASSPRLQARLALLAATQRTPKLCRESQRQPSPPPPQTLSLVRPRQ